MECRKWQDIGRVFESYGREIQSDTFSTDTGDYAACVQTYLLYQYGQSRNESEVATVPDGALGSG